MKKTLILLLAVMFLSVVKAETRNVKFTVEPPLVCNNCENKVKDNLRFEKGIKGVKPSAKKGEVEITYDDKKTSVERIKEGFSKIGYNATEIGSETDVKECTDSTDPDCKKENVNCCKSNSN